MSSLMVKAVQVETGMTALEFRTDKGHFDLGSPEAKELDRALTEALQAIPLGLICVTNGSMCIQHAPSVTRERILAQVRVAARTAGVSLRTV